MSTPEERQWRSYMKAKEAASKRRVLSPSEKEEMFRKRARESLRALYDKYPMNAHLNLNQEDSIYLPKLKEHLHKSRQDMQARMQELKTAETKAMAEFNAKYPKTFDDWQEKERQARIDSELFERVYQADQEKLRPYL